MNGRHTLRAALYPGAQRAHVTGRIYTGQDQADRSRHPIERPDYDLLILEARNDADGPARRFPADPALPLLDGSGRHRSVDPVSHHAIVNYGELRRGVPRRTSASPTA